jgi:peptidoglycan/xylan/chitin deacetylase (PgdA/CDA1 family)
MIISLLYHDVIAPGGFSTSGFSGGDAEIYKLKRSEFEAHLYSIEQAKEKGQVQLLDPSRVEIGSKALLFTFDDGGASALSAASMLESHGWRGHFFIVTDCLGKPDFLTREQVRELHHRGHVIGSHSCSHPARMSHCPPSQLYREWKESLRILSDLLSASVRIASVPGGYYSKAVASAAALAGIEALFSSEPTTRIDRVNGCLIVGRYSIHRGVSAETAARIASGAPAPRLRQYLVWNSKKIAKRISGNRYITLRKFLLRRSAEARDR